MKKIFYVFNTEEEALIAEAQISLLGSAPIVGKNAKTGQLDENKTKTIRWAIPKQRLDGKWVFPKINDEILLQYPQEIIDGFNSTHNYVLEDYDSSWFPTDEDE